MRSVLISHATRHATCRLQSLIVRIGAVEVLDDASADHNSNKRNSCIDFIAQRRR